MKANQQQDESLRKLEQYRRDQLRRLEETERQQKAERDAQAGANHAQTIDDDLQRKLRQDANPMRRGK